MAYIAIACFVFSAASIFIERAYINGRSTHLGRPMHLWDYDYLNRCDRAAQAMRWFGILTLGGGFAALLSAWGVAP